MNPGDRVELTAISDDYLPFGLTPGLRGTVEFTDSLGTVHIWWDDAAKRVGITRDDAALIRRAPGPRHGVDDPGPPKTPSRLLAGAVISDPAGQ